MILHLDKKSCWTFANYKSLFFLWLLLWVRSQNCTIINEKICSTCREEGIEELIDEEASIIYLYAINKGFNLTGKLLPDDEDIMKADFIDFMNLKEVYLDYELYRLLFEVRYCDYL